MSAVPATAAVGLFRRGADDAADLVAECVAAMIAASPRVEVTVKCRIGVDEQDPGRGAARFLSRMRDAGMRRITIHARKAWLQGLSRAKTARSRPGPSAGPSDEGGIS